MRLSGRIYDWQLPLERAALATAAELAGVRPGERLLDLATGTGGLLRELVARGVRPGEAVGIDRSPSMFADARASLPGGWSLVRGDARRPPFEDRSFDVVTACYLLTCSLPMTGYGVREMSRLLRPGGRAVTVTMESRRPVTRRLLGFLPRRFGLHPLDPASQLHAVALRPVRARFVRSGWPSLCLLTERLPDA